MGNRHFEKLTRDEHKELSRKGGLVKNPKKGTGSLNKEERIKRARDAALKRWRKNV